jgi:hypothetical protein
VQLKVGPNAEGKDARTVTVVPVADERSLRQHEWMEGNRKKVDELSGGKLAYVYVPDTAVNGFTYFNRYYFAQNSKQGAVIDERFNGSGWIADYIVDWLKRPQLMVAMTGEGKDDTIVRVIFGPKVMLINQYAGFGWRRSAVDVQEASHRPVDWHAHLRRAHRHWRISALDGWGHGYGAAVGTLQSRHRRVRRGEQSSRARHRGGSRSCPVASGPRPAIGEGRRGGA